MSETRHHLGFRTERHAHSRPSINIVIAGGYAETLDGRSSISTTGSAIVKPEGESHANDFRASSARCLLIETTACAPLQDIEREVISSTRVLNAKTVLPLAMRTLRELRSPDSVSQLALESLALEIMRELARRDAKRHGAHSERWLDAVREMLHDLTIAPSLAAIAAQVGRHPSHVARSFRARFGVSMSTYARRVRLERAALAVADGNRSLGTIALDAGYYDQSHFTREFRAFIGMSPTAYRATLRNN